MGSKGKDLSLDAKVLLSQTGLRLPNDKPMEKICIGMIFSHDNYMKYACEHLRPYHFYNEKFGVLFGVMRNAYKAGISPSIDYLTHVIKTKKLLSEQDAFIVTDAVISYDPFKSASPIDSVATYLIGLWMQRKVIQLANSMMYGMSIPTTLEDMQTQLDRYSMGIDRLRSTYNAQNNNDLPTVKYDPDEEIAPYEPFMVLNFEGKPLIDVCEHGGLITVTGSEGSRKSYLLSDMMIAMLGGQSSLGFMFPKKYSVLLIDTEQRKRTFQLNCNRIKKQIPKSNLSDFHAYAFLDYTEKERLRKVQYLIQKIRPDVVVLDGIVDLIDDYNNREKSKVFVNLLTQWVNLYNCSIFGVLHLAKSTGKTRGHLGTEMNNKHDLSIKTEIDPEYPEKTIVTCLKNRANPKFIPFEFTQTKSAFYYVKKEGDPVEGMQDDLPF